MAEQQDDGLGNPAYDAEAAQARAVGHYEAPTRRFLSEPRPDAPAVRFADSGAGYPVLLTDVWEAVFTNATTPSYALRWRIGDSVPFEVANQLR